MVSIHTMEDTMIEAAKSRRLYRLAKRTARPKRLAACLRYRDVPGRGALPHYFADILVDLASMTRILPLAAR
jgi:hypothetical protein